MRCLEIVYINSTQVVAMLFRVEPSDNKYYPIVVPLTINADGTLSATTHFIPSFFMHTAYKTNGYHAIASNLLIAGRTDSYNSLWFDYRYYPFSNKAFVISLRDDHGRGGFQYDENICVPSSLSMAANQVTVTTTTTQLGISPN